MKTDVKDHTIFTCSRWKINNKQNFKKKGKRGKRKNSSTIQRDNVPMSVFNSTRHLYLAPRGHWGWSWPPGWKQHLRRGVPYGSWSQPPWSWRPVLHWSHSWPMFQGKGYKGNLHIPVIETKQKSKEARWRNLITQIKQY